MISSADVVLKAARELFGNSLVVNVHRSVLVEAMVSLALPDWEWCSGDYSAFDFQLKSSGLHLEVKQSAKRQTWTPERPSKPSWDIKPRMGQWTDGSIWEKAEKPTRYADVYVFAWHPRDGEDTDHREPSQWRFFVIPTFRLPETQRLSLDAAAGLVSAVEFTELAAAVAEACRQVPRQD